MYSNLELALTFDSTPALNPTRNPSHISPRFRAVAPPCESAFSPGLRRKRALARCLPALACAAVLAPAAPMAHAQGSLTLYGFADAGIFRPAPGQPVQFGTMQRSFFGLRGSEPLGGGWAATMNLQTRFDMGDGRLEASGATPYFQGESTVGIRSPYGDLRFGRALTPMWQYDWQYDSWDNFNRVGSVAWFVYHPSYRTDPYRNGPAGEYSRLNNGVFYDSPKWGGVHVHVSAGVEKNETPDAAGNRDRTRPLAASLNYDAGPWSAMLTAERNSARDNTWFAGLAYAFSAVRLMASYSQTHLSAASQAFLGDASAKRSAATLGVNWRVGAATLKLSGARDFQGYGHAGTTGYVTSGLDYALSKRTTLYGAVSYRHSRQASGGTGFGAGISHSF
ncbi:porin [Cupriavidus sp.]|uniref:porin n=1 Tax=Cupriavidus sp. TaxID=1873897 RepID=UPI003D0FE071